MKKYILLFNRFFLLITLIFFLLIACKKEDTKIIKPLLIGQVQKGPFIIGTTVYMNELSSALVQTGKNFSTQISNNSGFFEIKNISLSSRNVEFVASGYYFDEVKGDLSTSPLTLSALSDINEITSANINILTHLEKLRVEYLLSQKKSFSEAKQTAQSEVLSIFGFSSVEMNNSESLDISVNKDENAILLAVSVILQGNRTVADLSELLANITNNIREDGILNIGTILPDLRNSTKKLDLAKIRLNLEKRYSDLGINASIPDFEKYINVFMTFTGDKPTIASTLASNIKTTGVTLTGVVCANSLNTVVTFEFGESVNYGNTVTAVQSPLNGSANVTASAEVTGLLPGSAYHYRINAVNSKGSVSSLDNLFTTLGRLPTATTLVSQNVNSASVILNASVNPNYLETTVSFEYGITNNYGYSVNATPVLLTGSTVKNVTASLTSLSVGAMYHFRVKATNSLGTTYGNDLTFIPKPSLGENYAGGIVFYIDQTGLHGLVCASTDQSTGIIWYNGSNVNTLAKGTAVGTGQDNTSKIVAAQGDGSYAAKLCDDLVLNGYSDWFLPSSQELGLVYHNVKEKSLGGFRTDIMTWYWTSTEFNQGNAIYMNFETDLTSDIGGEKYKLYRVRAIRAF